MDYSVSPGFGRGFLWCYLLKAKAGTLVGRRGPTQIKNRVPTGPGLSQDHLESRNVGVAAERHDAHLAVAVD
jgi:hypothetical protein